MNELMFDQIVISIMIILIGGIYFELFLRRNTSKEGKAEIRRSSRMRCLDEVTALIRGDDMYSGIGSDVKRAYYFAVQAANRKGK